MYEYDTDQQLNLGDQHAEATAAVLPPTNQPDPDRDLPVVKPAKPTKRPNKPINSTAKLVDKVLWVNGLDKPDKELLAQLHGTTNTVRDLAIATIEDKDDKAWDGVKAAVELRRTDRFEAGLEAVRISTKTKDKAQLRAALKLAGIEAPTKPADLVLAVLDAPDDAFVRLESLRLEAVA